MGLRDRLFGRSPVLTTARDASHGWTAAAKRIDLTDRPEDTRRQTTQAWQNDAWIYRDAIGEIRMAEDWLGSIMSRLRLYVGVIVEPNEPPVDVLEATTAPVNDDGTPTGDDPAVTDLPADLVQDAIEALQLLAGGAVGHGHLLHPLTVNLDVPGECYLLGIYDPEEGSHTWSVRSMAELTRGQDGVWVLSDEPSTGTTTGKRLDPELSYVARIWTPHPKWHGLADSPMRGILDACEGLLLASRKGRVRDRQALGNGMVLVPSEVDFEPEAGKPATPFMQRLTNWLVAAVSDESSAASLAPAVLRGPGEHLERVRRISLVDKDDAERDQGKIEKYLQRIGSGLDVPPEIIAGLKDVKFANAVAIDSTGFRYYLEPKAQREVDALTQGYLWEWLFALGHPPDLVRRLLIWYDPTEVISNPNRLPDALNLHEKLVIDDRSLRDAGGYPETAAPSEEELLRRIAAKTGNVDATLTAALLALVAQQAGITLPEAPGGDGAGGGGTGDGGDGTSLPTGEGQQPEAVTSAARGGNSGGSGRVQVGGGGAGGGGLLALVPGETRTVRVRTMGTTASQQPARFSALTLALDLDLRARVTAAADAAMRRTLERAGARVVSRVKSGSPHKAKIAGIPGIVVCATLGESVVQELGIDPDTLVAGAFDDLSALFATWATATWEQGLQAACELLSLTYYAPEALTAAAEPPPFTDADTAGLGGLDQVALRNRFAIDLAEAQEGLVADLAADARRRLFSPGFQAPEFGEHDPSLTIRPGTVRRALATAGGATSGTGGGVDDRGRAVNPDDGDPGYVATGQTIGSALTVAGVPQYAYRWVWGGSARPFPEHLALDGMTFADQSDSRLSVPDTYGAWLPGTSYFPGDHDGCQCSTERLVEDPFEGMTAAEERRVRAAQKARGADGRFVRTAVE